MILQSRPSRRRFLALALTAGALLVNAPVQAQTPSLQISAPETGAIVPPGTTVTVTVISPTGTVFSQVMVVGEGPVDLAELSSTLPLQASASIPAEIALRRYQLSASGRTPGGQEIDASPVFIDVERSDMPASLSFNSASLRFEAPGGMLPIGVLARFADGADLDVTESTRVSYSVADPQVASVSATGLVNALRAGQTTVTVVYSLGGQTVQAQVAVVVPAAVLTAAPQVVAFGDQNVGATVTQQVTLTNNGLGPVSVLNVASAGDFSAEGDCIDNSPLDPGTSCSIVVTFVPSSPGSRDALLGIETSFYSLPVGLPLSGAGIGQRASTTTLASSSPVSVFGQTVTLTATVTADGGDAPSGTVTFTDGPVVLGVEPLVNGVAALAAGSSWTPGTRTIVAAFDGNDQIEASSGSITQVVNRAGTQTTVTSSAAQATLGTPVTLVANVAVTPPGSGSASGTVTFRDGTTVLTVSPLSTAGQASAQLSQLSAGSHSLTATYSGDGNVEGSSAAMTQLVQYQAATVLCHGQLGHTVLAPLNPDGSSVFNRGRVVPVKFRVCDAAGNSIGTPGVVRSFNITGITQGTTNDVNEEVPSVTPDTSFRWDASAAQWIFNIDTQGQAADSTYYYTITLDDSTTITFQYGLR